MGQTCFQSLTFPLRNELASPPPFFKHQDMAHSRHATARTGVLSLPAELGPCWIFLYMQQAGWVGVSWYVLGYLSM